MYADRVLDGLCFNPRPHVGGDAVPPTKTPCGSLVSIHAPTWGATTRYTAVKSSKKFQSTPPRGGRLPRVSYGESINFGFNPRPHVGGDFLFFVFSYTTHRFNPRPHVGGDWGKPAYPSAYMVSIHAPTWGATSTTLTMFDGAIVSIHAPTWGATPIPRTMSLKAWFQSTPPRGGRLPVELPFTHLWGFNPRPHVGGDLFAMSDTYYPTGFNPRPHVGGDASLYP